LREKYVYLAYSTTPVTWIPLIDSNLSIGRLGDMMLSLMDAAQRDPELGRLVRAQNYQRRRFATTVIERAVARGDLPADVDVDLLVTLVAGPLVYTKLVRRQRVTEELVAAAVDTVLARYAIHADR